MSDMLTDGATYLRDTLKTIAANDITYKRENSSATVAATTGRTAFRQNNGTGRSQLIFSDRDFLIDPALLVTATGTNLSPPQKGDRITEADGTMYEVVSFNGEPCWRNADPFGKLIRVHTKRVPASF